MKTVVHLVQVVVRMKFIEISKGNFSEVAEIYAEGIATGLATFETSVPSWEDLMLLTEI